MVIDCQPPSALGAMASEVRTVWPAMVSTYSSE